MPLSGAIEKTMVNCDPNASIINVGWIRPNEHCFVMLGKMTPAQQKLNLL